ncbi:MAG: zf-HC2 domain-containing protein [Opitutae bacterium]|nr:zf-HC2 domain-containing protein [Opitutae bacterium]
MNCHDIEPLLLAERDGVLTPAQHAALAAHVATCPACRQLRAVTGEAVTFLKTDAANVTVPDADKEWRTLRARLRGETAKPARKRPLAPVILRNGNRPRNLFWFGAPLAAAAAITIAFFVTRPGASPAPTETTATTIAYVDKDSGWLVVWAAQSATKTKG